MVRSQPQLAAQASGAARAGIQHTHIYTLPFRQYRADRIAFGIRLDVLACKRRRQDVRNDRAAGRRIERFLFSSGLRR